MSVTRAAVALLLLVLVLASPAVGVAGQPPEGGAAMDEYVPVAELPPDEQLPAVPLVLFAYGFIWAAVLIYMAALWRRLGKVHQELDAVRRTLRD